MKQSAEYDAFTALVDRVLAVPRETILQREAAYRAEVERNPNRRGPKPKRNIKSSASDPASKS